MIVVGNGPLLSSSGVLSVTDQQAQMAAPSTRTSERSTLSGKPIGVFVGNDNLAPPASRNANLGPLVEGDPITLAARHAKISP
jgi:hypothetical protein